MIVYRDEWEDGCCKEMVNNYIKSGYRPRRLKNPVYCNWMFLLEKSGKESKHINFNEYEYALSLNYKY